MPQIKEGGQTNTVAKQNKAEKKTKTKTKTKQKQKQKQKTHTSLIHKTPHTVIKQNITIAEKKNH